MYTEKQRYFMERPNVSIGNAEKPVETNKEPRRSILLGSKQFSLPAWSIVFGVTNEEQQKKHPLSLSLSLRYICCLYI